MRKTRLFILLAVYLAVFTVSCKKTTETPRGKYAVGVFVVNEGNFTEANGSVGFYNPQDQSVVTDVYAEENGVAPGGVLQSVYFYNNLAFIIDQVGSRIEVVEAETFKPVATIETGLSTPRYMVVANGKGYVSNWGPFDSNFNLPESFVAVIDLNDFTISKTIPATSGPEGLFAFGNRVLVAASFAAEVQILDTDNDSFTGKIDVADGPKTFVEDKNGKVWLLSSSYVTGAALSQLDAAAGTVLKSFPVSSSAMRLAINGSGDQLYYLAAPFGADAEVKTVGIDATEDASEALITAPNLYGLGVDPASGIIYVGNHNGFQGNGTVLRYDGATMLDSFAAGVGPNGFVFRQ